MTRLLFACLFLATSFSSATAQEVTIQVDADRPRHAISPRLYGIFLEDINFGADGGLNSELVKNGSFEFPQSLMGWRKSTKSGSIGIEHAAPRRASNPHYLSVKSTKNAAASNEGFRGIGLHEGQTYQFRCWARTGARDDVDLVVRLMGDDDRVIAERSVKVEGSDWQDEFAELVPVATAVRARLEIAMEHPGSVDLDMVSLSPKDTWKGRPQGLRKDLVQLLADIKPAFFRFPGGCIVEGSALKYRYQWKQSIGDLADRRLLFNRWNTEFGHRLTPDYFQSFALGFYEYFVMSEEIGAEPLPIINCGMACQFNSGELVPISELQQYVQDALDLIEFANGPVTSRWGAKRAAMGHPEPFNMKMLGIGNEQWGPEYIERYKVFAEVLKEKHPEIELISGSGPFPNDQHYHYAWPELRALGTDIVDEHCYAMPDWFLKASRRYDSFERNGPKVFMGEYAAQSVDITSPHNENNLRCALAEAAFMTGMERNSDVVVMSSYAPLLGHEDAWQWRPNLVWFDNLKSYGTPNYYVQQLFSLHKGDEVLPVELSDTRPAEKPSGRIGFATFRGSAEFKDVRVQKGDEILFASDQLDNLDKATSFRGDWAVEGGAICQRSSRGGGRLLIGDHSWGDYTLSLKARRLSGDEGFIIIFRNSSGGSFLEWNLGGWGNKEHGIQAHLASHSTDTNILARAPGTIEADRWYDIRIELSGSKVKCFLDEQLVHDLDVPAPELDRVYATASIDRQSEDLILKVVNVGDKSAATAIKFTGIEMNGFGGEAIVLTGSPDDKNTITEPDKIRPQSTPLKGVEFDQPYVFPAHSLTILRLRAAPK